MKNYNSQVILVNDILKRCNVEFCNRQDLLELYKDVKELEFLIIESGKNKVGNGRCRISNKKDIDKVMLSVIIRWGNIKIGI